jgi:lysophospholipase L1-like esterase
LPEAQNKLGYDKARLQAIRGRGITPLVVRKTGIWIAMLGSLILAGCKSPGLHSSADSHWIASWGASPVAGEGGPFASGQLFDNQTVRMVVHGSVGGDQVRLRLSNDYGNDDVVIGAASVALQSAGSKPLPGTYHGVTFAGSESITLAAGSIALSDPVPLISPDLSDYVISLYLPVKTAAVTAHTSGRQTAWISAAGNHTGKGRFPVVSEREGVFLLAGLEVLTSQADSVLVAFGDSITDGAGSALGENTRWPDFLARRLAAAGELDLGIVNQGIGGNRLLHDVVGDNAQARFERDVLAWPNLGYIIVMVGINDLGFSAIENFPMADSVHIEEVALAEMIAGYRQLIARAHAWGVRIYGATLTPYKGAGYFTEAGETKRQGINTWIRESGEYDGVIDFDRAVRDPEDPSRMRADLHGGDWLHPNGAGYAAMAEAVDLGLFRE